MDDYVKGDPLIAFALRRKIDTEEKAFVLFPMQSFFFQLALQ